MLHKVSAGIAWLVVAGAVGQHQRQEPQFGNAVIVRNRGPCKRDQDLERVHIDHVKEDAKIACDADVGTAIDHFVGLLLGQADCDQRARVAFKSTDPGGTDNMCHTVNNGGITVGFVVHL